MANTLSNAVDHPDYYGGADDTYEAIKVIEAWGLGFHLGNTVKYICRAGLKAGNSSLQDLEKAAWYLNRKIEKIKQDAEAEPIQTDTGNIVADIGSFRISADAANTSTVKKADKA